MLLTYLGLFAGANPAGILNEFQELQALIEILETILEIINNLKLFTTDIDFDMDFIDDMTANPTTNFTAALQNMVTFKLEAHNFDEMKVWANDYLKRVDESTDFGINNAYKLTMAYENTANTGKELVSEVYLGWVFFLHIRIIFILIGLFKKML